MERNLSFCFQYECDDNDDCPDVVHVTPNPNTITDTELTLIANTCIQALASKHGLGQALAMVNDTVYGKLANGTQFNTKWVEEDDVT